MGIVLTDYVIESVIRDGLRDLRDRPELVDDLFSQMLQTYLKTEYGDEVLNQIKSYLKDEKIYVVQSYSLNTTKLPCFSINLDNLNESDRDAAMQDYGGYTEESITPTTIVSAFSGTYDSVSHAILIGDSVDLSSVRVGNYFTDTAGTNFNITSVVTTTGNKKVFIQLGANGEPDVSGDLTIVSQIGTEIVEYEVVPLREKVLIGVYAQNDPNLTKYLYYLLMYFIHQRKSDLESRGVELSSITASDFMREESDQPENIYSRYVSLNCLTYFKWSKTPVDVFGGVSIDIRVPLDEVVTDIETQSINTETEE